MQKLKIQHLKQSQETSCGAAALAMVYQYLNIDGENEGKIFERIKTPRPDSPGQYYLRTWNMAQDSMRFDLTYFIGQAVLDSSEIALQPIKEFLSASIPVIVCQRVDASSKFGHFRVITGIGKDKVSLNDPLLENPSEVSVDEFMALWQRTSDDEVIGGQLIAIFRKEQLNMKKEFLIKNFDSPVHSFKASFLNFSN